MNPSQPTCSTCPFFHAAQGQCRETPTYQDRSASDWCGQHPGFSDYLKSLRKLAIQSQPSNPKANA